MLTRRRGGEKGMEELGYSPCLPIHIVCCPGQGRLYGVIHRREQERESTVR